MNEPNNFLELGGYCKLAWTYMGIGRQHRDRNRIIETPAIDQLFPLDVENKKEKEVDWMKEGF